MKVLLLALPLFFSFNIEAKTIENVLKHHASPYLAMHGDDPVAWQEWNKATVERAKKEGKLLYVSSGYFSCHWCHVMQRESYKDAQVAKILNTYFIPVKVDREINSALDSHLIDFVERTQGRAGWPLNVFITPDGYPLVGMTYVPTDNFIKILDNLKLRWKKERPLLENIAKNATAELGQEVVESSDKIAAGLGDEYIKRFLMQAQVMQDEMSGGFGAQNKFPSYPQLHVMLGAYENQPDKELRQFLELTLNKMATQGLYDQLGHGFFRYTVDPLWQIPHFEKMLYDNALLASLYTDAARIFNNQQFVQVAKHTLNFLIDVFQSRQGAYIASLSALDSKGNEGGYYLWQRDELKKILNQNELKVVELIWQLEGPADLEGGHHLVEIMNVADAAKMLKMSKSQVQQRFDSAKKKMLAARNKRRVPADGKLLAAWNGLALSAFSRAAKQFNEPVYKKAARDIKNYIHKKLWDGHKLARVVKQNKILAQGGLEDYAYLAQGLYQWLKLSSNQQDQLWLENIIEQAWARFYTTQGWLLSENSLLKYGAGETVIADGVLPSASAVLIDTSLKVAKYNKNKKLKSKALKALNSGQTNVVNQPFWYASHIQALFDYQKTLQ